jgi:hypothetical protein
VTPCQDGGTAQRAVACPPRFSSLHPAANTAAAKRFCAACPVTSECLRYAQAHACHHGIWGGLTEHKRMALRVHPA